MSLLPNVIWNAQNGFVTLTHVGHNIQGSGAAFSPLHGLEFLASQFAVFGPVAFSVLRHPTVAGQRRIGSLLYGALMHGYAEYRRRNAGQPLPALPPPNSSG